MNYPDSVVIVFISDMFVYLKNECDHMGQLRLLLQVIKEHQLFFKYSKCVFLLRSVVFLFHIISSKGVVVDSKKMEKVKNCPTPLTPTDIRSFLGLAGY